ncbi:trypsin-like peptidase domain-containing protein [Oculatella sp. LEGE 06141]|uniref:S1C family serine protease n=1 Tax=Oculatella sp. LEGE 06141 TaxID=1828648 RepID=UPI001881EF27|nr:trypsin-like peptidase domain-containing protein [Oculatella sp. LEGE 06141]MBE9181054.1 trypsin-like peptidase domain-containing protein [Oculatella sp. LEGE 06141]
MTPLSDSISPLVALSNDLADAIAHAANAIVTVNARQRCSSSGVHWQPGIVVTADHTIKREEDITVTVADDRTLAATLVGRDSGTDLAVLRLQEVDLPAAELVEAPELKVGHMVLALGRSSDGIAASFGVISALGGTWRSWHGGQIDQFIRPDLTLYPGFSGGALINLQGQVIGMNTSGPRHTTLTIPVSTVSRVVNQLLQRGRIARGYLGVGMQPLPLPDRLRQSLNLPNTNAVIIISTESGSPADQAGVLIGDILVRLNDRPIEDIHDVHAMLDPEQVSKPLTAQIIRGGALIECSITIGERLQR